MEIQELHRLFLTSSGVSTDTRKIGNGSMFFALRGDRFDANTFAAEALERGASFVVIDNEAYAVDARTILVPDSLEALQQLAAYHRAFLNIPIIGLTGSNGKTTTKELIHAVLRQQYNTGATLGNLNNHIGVPLTLLSFTEETEIGIVEMGANHQKEIAFLCEIARPDYGYITNFGKAHLEGFGGFDGVIKGKSELYDYLRQHGKTAIVNLDDALQAERSAGIRAITFSTTNATADVLFAAPQAAPFVRTRYGATSIQSHLIGLYNAHNIHAAVAIGRHFDVPDTAIRDAIEGYIPANNRSQIIKKGGHEIILDAYNANPSSMKEALGNFLQLDLPDKTAFLGDMFELGTESDAEHSALVAFLADAPQLKAVFIGPAFYAVKQAHPSHRFFQTFEQAASWLGQHPLPPQHILIKGSRGMALERLLDVL